MNTTGYRPSFQRGNFQPVFASRYVPVRMAQATPTPPVPAAPAPSKPNVPMVLGASAAAGALLGYLGTIVLQKLDKKTQRGAPLRISGTVGGLIGGLVGAGTVLLLKD